MAIDKARKQAVKDKLKAKLKAKAAELIEAKKQSIKKKRAAK
jgi:hypothetical protein